MDTDNPSVPGPFTTTELAGLAVTAAVVAVVLGPGAITVSGVDSAAVTAVSVVLTGALAALVGALALLATKRS